MATSDTKQNNPQEDQNFQNPHKGNKGQQKASSPASHPITGSAGPDYESDLGTDENSNSYDSENPDNEPGPQCKDITEKDTQEDLIENDPSQGLKLTLIHKRAMRLKATALKPLNRKRIIRSKRNSKSGSLETRSFSRMNAPAMSRAMAPRAMINLPSENFNVLRSSSVIRLSTLFSIAEKRVTARPASYKLTAKTS